MLKIKRKDWTCSHTCYRDIQQQTIKKDMKKKGRCKPPPL